VRTQRNRCNVGCVMCRWGVDVCCVWMWVRVCVCEYVRVCACVFVCGHVCVWCSATLVTGECWWHTHKNTHTCIQAVKTYVRFITLWSVKLELKSEQRAKLAKGIIQFSVSPGFEFSNRVRNEDQQVQFMSVLKYMFGGDFGFDLESACSSALPSFDLGSVASISMSKLAFFERLQLHGQSAEKSFCPYMIDARNSTRSLPNPSSTPRVGSTVLVDGLPGHDGEIVVRIQVRFLFVQMFTSQSHCIYVYLTHRQFFLSVFRMKVGLGVLFQLWQVGTMCMEISNSCRLECHRP